MNMSNKTCIIKWIMIYHIIFALGPLTWFSVVQSTQMRSICIMHECFAQLKLMLFSFFQEEATQEFKCHYRDENWPTGRYFEFVEDFFNTANSSREDVDCEPPPCPTTTKTTITTTITTTESTRHHSKGKELLSATRGNTFLTVNVILVNFQLVHEKNSWCS